MDLQSVLESNWGISLIAGGIVAALQLLAAYALIERYVDKVRLKAERQKWETSRRELCATLLYFTHVICRPAAHYSVLIDEKLHPRQNITSFFSHIDDKCRDFNSLLSIYVNAIPPEWYARIVSSSFELQAAAASARSAVQAWEKFETLQLDTLIGRFSKGSAFQIDFDGSEIRAMVESDNYKLPIQVPERHVAYFLFCYYHTLLSIADTASGLHSIITTIMANVTLSDLNRTAIFGRLNRVSQRQSVPLNAEYFHKQMLVDLQTTRSYVNFAKKGGMSLALQPEFD